jgi:hypothetical protein
VDHPLTTFVALAKATGTVWVRDRPPRLAPLQQPFLATPLDVSRRGVYWSTALWFPDGIPANLLERVRKQK